MDAACGFALKREAASGANSGNHFLDDPPVYVRQAEVAAGVAERQALVVQPK
jgi:hypothetical protein